MESVNSIQDLVNLVDSLYTEKDPSKINTIQTYLQSVQKSPDGLKFADLLLSDPSYSLNCKFFGSLTYMVNLTQSKDIDADLVLSKLLQHLTTSIHDNRHNNVSNIFIIRKLYSNLSKIFITLKVNQQIWNRPLDPVIQILVTDQYPDLSKEIDYQQFLGPLISDYTTLNFFLIYASTIIEDLNKQNGVDIKIHEVVQSNIYPLVKYIMTTVFQGSDIQLKLLCLQHLGSWVSYVSQVEFSTVVRYKDFNDVLQYLLDLFQSPEDELYQGSVEILTLIFETNPHLLSSEIRTQFNALVSSEWFLGKINGFFQNDDVDSLEAFVVALIAMLDADIVHLFILLFNNESSPLLSLLLNLTNIPLPPILEEHISIKFIEFWTQLSELYVDEFDTIEARLRQDQTAIQKVKEKSQATFREVSGIYFKKIQLLVTSNSDFKQQEQEFFSYRQDVLDLFESIYSNIGISIYENLVNNVITGNDINDIEASLYILNGITQNLTIEGQLSHHINSLFSSNFLGKYNDLCSQIGDASHYYLKSSLTFLGSVYTFYRTDGSQYLNTVIGYLFNCLKNQPSLQLTICKTIVTICDECSSQLLDSIANFEPILVEMIKNNTVDPYLREKIIYSVACIIQSIPVPDVQAKYIFTTLTLIDEASKPLLSTINTLNEEQLVYLGSLFSSVKELAKALVFSEDFEENLKDVYDSFKAFYEKDDSITRYVTQLINSFMVNKKFLSTAVEIFQTGLLEDFGPFSFSSQSVIEFAFSRLEQHSPDLSSYLELFNTTLNVGLRKSAPVHQKINEESVVLILNNLIFSQIDYIDQDPDLLQLAINIFTTIVLNNPGFLLHNNEQFKLIITKTLFLLRTSEERFVKKALLKFWTNLIGVKKVTAEEAAAFSKLFEQEIGSILTSSVFNGLFTSVRSDVDSYSNIIVVLLSRYQLYFRDWIKEALNSIDEQRVNKGLSPLPEKEFFIKQLLLTRGSTRKCNNIIKEYWAKANGLMSYQTIYSK